MAVHRYGREAAPRCSRISDSLRPEVVPAFPATPFVSLCAGEPARACLFMGGAAGGECVWPVQSEEDTGARSGTPIRSMIALTCDDSEERKANPHLAKSTGYASLEV